ncbi:MAG TPA: SulP family inorganic anion transporter [Trebonia sp.]
MHLLAHLGDASWATFAVGAVALGLLFALDRVQRVPGGLVVLALAIVVSTAFHLDRHGVKTVGKVPAGLPSVHGLHLPVADLWVLLPSAAGMMLVICSEALGAADTFAEKHGYQLEPSQEMIALGLANIGSGFLGGLAADGSLSQSSVNDGAGARSELSSVIAGALSLVTVVALTPLFTYLPEAVLAAMIIHAVSKLMKVAEMRRYYHLVRREFWLGMITLVGVITLDVLPGLVIGVVLSLLVLAYLASRPVFSVMGAVPEVPGAYEDVRRHASLTCTCTRRTCCGAPARADRAPASVRFRPLTPPFAGRVPVSPPGASALSGRDAGRAPAGPRRWSDRRLDVAPLLEDLGRPLIAVAHHHEDDRRDQARAAADHQDDPDHLQVDVLRGPGDGEAQDRADQDEEDADASTQRDQPPFT